MFGVLKQKHYLCTRQLVILIYIYHFPMSYPSVRIDNSFSFPPFRASSPARQRQAAKAKATQRWLRQKAKSLNHTQTKACAMPAARTWRKPICPKRTHCLPLCGGRQPSVSARPEDGSAYAHHGGAFIDGYAVVVAHAHAHCVEIWAGVEV